MTVSGTKRPPNGPKWPARLGSVVAERRVLIGRFLVGIQRFYSIGDALGTVKRGASSTLSDQTNLAAAAQAHGTLVDGAGEGDIMDGQTGGIEDGDLARTAATGTTAGEDGTE